MWLLVSPLLQQAAIVLLMSYVGKVAHLLLLWLIKKMLKGLHWAANHTDIKTDDELVELLEKALELQAAEPAPPIEPPSKS